MIVQPVLVVAAALFSLGIYGILVRRNAVMVLLSIELILNSVNINFIMFDTMLADTLMQGQIFTIFIITIAAAEVGIGLAIVLMLFRNRQTANINEFDLMKWKKQILICSLRVRSSTQMAAYLLNLLGSL